MTGGELRQRRRRLGLSQEQLAQRLGVHRVTVNRWEQGRVPIERPLMLRVMLDSLAAEGPTPGAAPPTEPAPALGEATRDSNPAVASVLRVMRERGLSQEEAVRLLGGPIPWEKPAEDR